MKFNLQFRYIQLVLKGLLSGTGSGGNHDDGDDGNQVME